VAPSFRKTDQEKTKAKVAQKMKNLQFSPAEKRRLDILLKAAIPASYNTFPRRYGRAIDALLHVRNDIPGDDRDGELTFTEATAREWLSIRASGRTPNGPSHVAFLIDALAVARSDAARDSEIKGRDSRRRVSSGKFAAKIYGLKDAAP
jgi:hypothetical protein